MQFTTTTALLSLFLSLTSASPTPHHDGKNCLPKRIYPVTVPNNHTVARINPYNYPDFEDSVYKPKMAFIFPDSVPASSISAGPCALVASFEADYEVIDSSVNAGGQPIALNFRALDGPAKDSMVGTVRIPTFKPNLRTKEPFNAVVNTFGCRKYQSFQVELEGVGEVGFINEANNGIWMEYGC